jgi:hypothetical protein
VLHADYARLLFAAYGQAGAGVLRSSLLVGHVPLPLLGSGVGEELGFGDGGEAEAGTDVG